MLTNFGLLTVEIRKEHDVVLARRRALQIAKLLQYEARDQIRVATAVSELARNVYEYAKVGQIRFSLMANPPSSLIITVSDKGPGIEDLQDVLAADFKSSTGLGLGLKGARSLVDRFSILSNNKSGTSIELAKFLPSKSRAISATFVAEIAATLAGASPQTAFEEMQAQNQVLMAALAEVERQQQVLEHLNAALEDAARQSEAANRAKTDFLANVSHEIRTPMTAIAGLSALLAKTPLTDKQAKYVSTLRKSAESMTLLINDLMDISKIEDGKVVLEAIPFSLKEVIDHVVEIGAVAIGDKDVEIRRQFRHGLSRSYIGDPQRLHQILLNLVSNAVKFTSAGTVTIDVEEERDTSDRFLVLLHVRDTGIGIAPDRLARVFDKFVQAETSTTRHFGGSGLGLTIARSLTELMGGELSAASQLGVGSTFTVSLPLKTGMDETRAVATASLDEHRAQAP